MLKKNVEKKKKKVLGNILLVIYAIIAVFTTICLLSYNDFKVTEFGDNSFVLITNDEYTPDFNSGDLVIVNSGDKININDKAFFYNTYDRNIEVKLGNIEGKEEANERQTTYTVEGGHRVSGEYVLGPAKTATVIGEVGTVLAVLESKWGFLFLIVFPALLAFIYQITTVASEIKEGKQDKEDKKNEE